MANSPMFGLFLLLGLFTLLLAVQSIKLVILLLLLADRRQKKKEALHIPSGRRT